MKTLKEALIKKHTLAPEHIIKHDPVPVNLEDVIQFFNYKDHMDFTIGASRWNTKGIDDLTEWLVRNVFEMPDKKENFSLWILNEFDIDQDPETQIYFSGRWNQDYLSQIHKRLLSSKSEAKRIWKKKVEELVTSYDAETSLSCLHTIVIKYWFSDNNANKHKQVSAVQIELI